MQRALWLWLRSVSLNTTTANNTEQEQGAEDAGCAGADARPFHYPTPMPMLFPLCTHEAEPTLPRRTHGDVPPPPVSFLLVTPRSPVSFHCHHAHPTQTRTHQRKQVDGAIHEGQSPECSGGVPGPSLCSSRR
jgi:hypothetical protein